MPRHFCKGGGGAYVDTDCKDCMRRLEHPEEFPLTEVEEGMTVEQATASSSSPSVSAAGVASASQQAHTPTSREKE